MQGSRANRTANDSPRHRPRILCASADPARRHDLARALADDFEVIEVSDGVAALQAAREHLPELVLSDLAPGIESAELLAALRVDAGTRSMPVIFVGDHPIVAHGTDYGAGEADEYLVRPFTAPELVDRVHRNIALRQAQRAWAIEGERARRALLSTDHEEWCQAAEDVPLLAKVERCELTRERIDLTAVARPIAAELQRRGAARDVDVRVADGLIAVADRSLVWILLEQLLANAWKFTRRRADAEIVVESQHPGVFLVRDNGAGFDMAHCERLFRPYQRLHSGAEFEGAGIGLAIVRRVVERHGGEIWAHGLVDHGATVWFTLGADSEPPG